MIIIIIIGEAAADPHSTHQHKCSWLWVMICSLYIQPSSSILAAAVTAAATHIRTEPNGNAIENEMELNLEINSHFVK